MYRELAVRAWRDEATRVLVASLDAGWLTSVEAIVQRGKVEGVFRPNVVPAAAASAIVAALWGAVTLLCLPPSRSRASAPSWNKA